MKKIAVALMVVATGLVGFAAIGTTASADSQGKVFVCKYVGTPFVDERLQTGDNPISVSVNSIPSYDKDNPAKDEASELVGDEFTDQQGQSIVLVEDTGQPEPDPSSCPPPRGPCPNGTVTTTITETVTVTADAPTGEVSCTTTVTTTVTETTSPPTTTEPPCEENCTTTEPPTTTVPPTTTTPPPTTTTPTETTTATPPPSTTEPSTTTEPPKNVPNPPNKKPPKLAFTGSRENAAWLAGIAALLLLVGLFLLRLGTLRKDDA